MRSLMVVALGIAALAGAPSPTMARVIPQAPLSTPGNLPPVLISAVHYYGFEGTADEAVQLANTTPVTVSLDATWSLLDAAGHRMTFSPPLILAADARAWLAHEPAAFTRQFGAPPQGALSATLGLANSGGGLQLITETTQVLDVVNGAGGSWPAGAASPSYASMERIDASAPDAGANWAAPRATGAARDRNGAPITGSPGTTNTVAVPFTPRDGVAINEVGWAGTQASSTDEWIELLNLGPEQVAVDGWRIDITSGATLRTVPLSGSIAPGAFYLVQRTAGTFSAGAQADLTDSRLSLSNAGATLRLVRADMVVVDAVLWGSAGPGSGWAGPPVQAYTVTQSLPADGQLLMRKLPLTDTDRGADWINTREAAGGESRPAWPGWALEQFAQPVRASSHITVALAPDASFTALSNVFQSTRNTLDIESYTFESAAIAHLLRSRVLNGVRVRVLLDGAPAGGFSNQTRWACQQISAAPDSGCWFMRSDAARNIHARYKELHAKLAIADGRLLVVSTENLGSNGYPDDDPADGTAGHRGALAIVDAPELVARGQAIFDADFDPAQRDITPWCAAGETTWCAPPVGYVPITTSGGISYTPHFTQPLVLRDPVTVALWTSPESHLRKDDGLLAALDAAGAGDEILAVQLNEPHYWGPLASNPDADPNPRVRAMLGAVSRGARSYLMLDKFYADRADTRGNYATATYLNAWASQSGGHVQVQLENPTSYGIHSKVYLIHRNMQGYTHLGSWNGTEVSAKRNREASLWIESDAVRDYLAAAFWRDWWLAQPHYLPLIESGYAPAPAPTHLLISEVMPDPGGLDDGREWIELHNPTAEAQPLAGFKIGDAEAPGRGLGDGMFAFPPDARIAAGGVLVIAQNAALYFQDHGRAADYELADYDAGVPDLHPYLAWSDGIISLSNTSDQVLLLGPGDEIVDALQWGAVVLANSPPCLAPAQAGHSLQRWPPQQDTDDCTQDFRSQALPSPGSVP